MVSSQFLEVPLQLSLSELSWLVQPVFVIGPHSPKRFSQEQTSNVSDLCLALQLFDTA